MGFYYISYSNNILYIVCMLLNVLVLLMHFCAINLDSISRISAVSVSISFHLVLNFNECEIQFLFCSLLFTNSRNAHFVNCTMC